MNNTKNFSIILFIFLLAGNIWLYRQLKDQTKKPPPPPYAASEIIMGTAFTILIASDKLPENLKKISSKAFQRIKDLDKKYSTYKPNSLLSRINQSAGKKPLAVDDETIMLFEFAEKLSQLSEGAFDITFHSFKDVWNYNKRPFLPPKPAFIEESKKWINYQNIEINKENKTIFLKDANTKVGMGAYVKGYAVDQAAKVLKDEGLANFIVNGGGDIYLTGTKYDKHWTTGIQHPRESRGRLLFTIPISEPSAVVTSGDYEKYVIIKNKRYHHIIDPRTGYPAEGLQSVSVMHPQTMLADALATTLFILGKEKGDQLIKQHYPAARVLYIDELGKPSGDRELVDKIQN